jgi:predicted acetyltransferase
MKLLEVHLQKIGMEKKHVLENLFQFYDYEFSSILEKIKVNRDGCFPKPDVTAYLTQNNYQTFLITVGQDLVGFVIVNTNLDSEGTRTISEFFVMKKYSGKGIGKIAAKQVFDMFPGKWLIHQVAKNYNAQAFWRKVIYDYTKGSYKEWYGDQRKSFQEFDTFQIPEIHSDSCKYL